MRDPHVERLHYKIGSEEGTSYRDPKPITFTNHLGRFDARDGNLLIEPSDHFADKDDARAVIEPFLRAWEMEADLTWHIGTIRFEFLRADLVDRDPPPPGTSQTVHPEAVTLTLTTNVDACLTVTRNTYPSPPECFRTTSDVEQAYRRWRAFRASREPLQSMAYFVLTLIEAAAGSRKRTGNVFDIDKAVLNTIGRLSSERGDPSTARKAKRGGAFQELTASEKDWLEHAVRRLIRRLGEHASGAALDRITMKDLPTLK